MMEYLNVSRHPGANVSNPSMVRGVNGAIVGLAEFNETILGVLDMILNDDDEGDKSSAAEVMISPVSSRLTPTPSHVPILKATKCHEPVAVAFYSFHDGGEL